ncbi:MAG: class I SAM-dependent methyltransferase [bacterium]
MNKTIKAWEKIFQKSGKVFIEPHEYMDTIVQILKKQGVKKVLDLGSGSGRHVIYLAKNGFLVYGLDNSSSGLKITKKWLNNEGLNAELVEQEMDSQFPWKDDFFDAIISIQVIHHADIATIKKIICEIERVIRKNGFIFITVPKLKNQGENFKEIEPNTYIPLDGHEKGLPHHYFTTKELKNFFSNFNIVNIHIDRENHYCLSAFKI